MWAIALFSIFAAVFYSCTKENNMSNNSVKSNNPQMSQEDIRVMNLILDFKKKIDFYRANPNIKSGESKSVDSTVWYLEAAANLYYGEPNFEANKVDYSSTTFEVTKTNGEVLMTDILLAFDKVINHLNTHYASIEGSNKQLTVADVALEEDASDKVTLRISSSIKKGGTTGIEAPFHFYWGLDMGNCSSSPNIPGDDAADILTNGLETDFLVEHPPIGGNGTAEINGYFTDVVSFAYNNNGQWTPPTPNNYELFYENGVPIDQLDICIGNTDMIAYKDLMTSWTIDYKPSGTDYEVSSVLCKDNLALYEPTPGQVLADIRHEYYVSYGIWHYGCNTN
jgi:hypothetical protein